MRLSAFILIAVSLTVAGCATAPAPQGYSEPPFSVGHSATLKGLSGTYVAEIDQAFVFDAQEQVPDLGWNTVLVEPGVHHLRVMINRRNGYRIETRTVGFTFRCDAGHVYEFTSKSPQELLTLKVTDVKLNQSLVVDRSDEPADNLPPAASTIQPQVADIR